MFLHQQYESKSVTTLHSCSELQERFSNLKKTRSLSYRQSEGLARMTNLLNRKVRNRKCYCFQVFKQFIIFPDSSYSSSCLSLSKYDPLIFSDQKLHSLQKILQTQLFQRKIWAFINLKMNRKEQQIKEFTEKSEFAIKKMHVFQKQQSFKLIKQLGKRVQRQSNLQKHVMFNLSINNSSKYLDLDQKPQKFQHNISKRTAETEKEANSALKSMMEMRSFVQNSCRSCSCYYSCCCCSSNYSYNLQDRIQYLKRLEQMVSLKERSALYR